MNPNDRFKGHKSFHERKAERIAARGLPSDHQKPDVAPPATVKAPTAKAPVYQATNFQAYAGGVISGSFNDQIRYMNQMINFSIGTVASEPDPQFSGKEFAIGVARGARSFKVDRLGRLTGIHYTQVWTPGENHSECRAEARAHKEGDFAEKCRCGFYGYYDGSNDFHADGTVSGVIEGYGEAVLGSRGFRVTKARIVALTIADDASGPLARLVRQNYSAIPFFDTFTRMVSEFPPDYELDTKDIPSPDSDPEFWTRAI